MNRLEAHRFRMMIEHAASFQDDETALQSVELYPVWKPEIDVDINERYSYNGVLFKVIQGHHTQEGWEPDITPALFVRVSVEEFPEWRQPQGSHDAYMSGDKVSHNGQHWINTIDYNTYEPGVYGWNTMD